MLGVFGKKKSETPSDPNPEPALLSRLQELTGNDAEMYQSLSRLLFLDPKRITTTLEDAASQASSFESSGGKTRAEVWYRIAGGIALYRGDVEAVRKFFEKASSIVRDDSRPEYKTISKRSQEAVELARKYYEIL